VEWVVIAFMALSYFGKGIGALGWAVNADTAPKEITGLSGSLFNTFGNLSSIITPIAIGYIIKVTGSFNWALVFVSVHAFLAIISYILLSGKFNGSNLKQYDSTETQKRRTKMLKIGFIGLGIMGAHE
jgi:ACS family glucarate transporter-like MFS transporter